MVTSRQFRFRPAGDLVRINLNNAAATSTPYPSLQHRNERRIWDFGRSRLASRGDPALGLPKGAAKIVIADDYPRHVELREAYLSDLDCEIRTAYDGEE